LRSQPKFPAYADVIYIVTMLASIFRRMPTAVYQWYQWYCRWYRL